MWIWYNRGRLQEEAFMRKYNPHVEEARRNLDYAELSRLGKLGARARWAKRRIELEQREELELMERDRLFAGVEQKLRQGNEIDFPPR